MPESYRALTGDSLEIQARMLGLDLTAVDAQALLERVKSGLKDLDRADEIHSGRHEPSVTFNSGQRSQ